jgi:glycosyltransferase involved in cell wall biosynthesis
VTERLMFWLPAISPYWVERLNALRGRNTVEFSVLLNRLADYGRHWAIDPATFEFEYAVLADVPRFSRVSAVIDWYWRHNPDAVVTFHSVPSLWAAWFHRLRGRRLHVYLERTWDSQTHRTRAKEVLKRLLIGTASSVLVPGPDAAAYARTYGARVVSPLEHVVNNERFHPGATQIERRGPLRCLNIGSQTPDKGIPLLMSVFDQLWAAGVQVELSLIGDGTTPGLDEWVAANQGVTRKGFVQTRELPALFRSHDVFLFPTRHDTYGLVVDEAMACGVPVIGSSRTFELQPRLHDGRGWVLSPDSPSDWVATLATLIRRPDEVIRARERCIQFSAQRGIDLWVAEIERLAGLPTSEDKPGLRSILPEGLVNLGAEGSAPDDRAWPLDD